jgi:hypothetical protein
MHVANSVKESGARAAKLTREQYLDLYYYMQLNRQLEDRMVRLFRQNKIVGGLYSSLGQKLFRLGTAHARAEGLVGADDPHIGASGERFCRAISSRNTWRNILRPPSAKTAPATSATESTPPPADFDAGDLIPVMTESRCRPLPWPEYRRAHMIGDGVLPLHFTRD